MHEKILRDKLNQENAETIELGRKQLIIQEQQDHLNLTKEMYDAVRRRIQQLEMERKRPARISLYYYASTAPEQGKRFKLLLVILFGSLALGAALAVIADRADRRVHTPDDIIRSIGVPMLGTTIGSDHIDKHLLRERVENDYQTIRANLGLISGGRIPHILAVTSAGMREGKTTLAINLSTSLAKARKKVLLIDGDLRKPDIARLLKIENDSWGLNDILYRIKDFERVVCTMALTGLDVLTTDGRNASNAIELLENPQTQEWLKKIAEKYDHVIIDTPPVLAVPDALWWARMADGVVLSSFAGQTMGPAVKETMDRLAQVKANVLGNVLSNVKLNHAYYGYGGDYYGYSESSRKTDKQDKARVLLLNAPDHNNTKNNDS